jgi:hypothetical protein
MLDFKGHEAILLNDIVTEASAVPLLNSENFTDQETGQRWSATNFDRNVGFQYY